jgi:hypothetical protein
VILRALVLLAPFGIVVVWSVSALRAPGDDKVRRWARRNGLSPTGANAEVVRHYLAATGRARCLGLLIGVAFAFAARVGWSRHPGWATNPLYLAIGGYLLGTIASELRAQTAPRDEHRYASLRPRRVTDYQPRWLRYALLAATSSTIALAGWLIVNPESGRVGGEILHTTVCKGITITSAHVAVSTGLVLGGAAVAVLATTGAVAVAYLVAHRPQPLQAPDLILADQAIRASSASTAARAALGLVLGNIGVQLFQAMVRWDLPCANRTPTRVVGTLAMAALIAALAVWTVPPRRRSRGDESQTVLSR